MKRRFLPLDASSNPTRRWNRRAQPLWPLAPASRRIARQSPRASTPLGLVVSLLMPLAVAAQTPASPPSAATSPAQAPSGSSPGTAPPPRPSSTSAPVDDIPPAYRSLADRAVRLILLDRDLTAAEKLLVDALPSALQQVAHPAWTARIYVLLATIALLEGDDPQALKLSRRAVILDRQVYLEPQLGVAARRLLEAALKDTYEQEVSAAMAFLPLPDFLTVYLDGSAVAVVGPVGVLPGEHLVQVTSNGEVIARAWVRLEVGGRIVEPPPLPEIRAALNRATPAKEALPPDELEKRATEAAAATDEILQLQKAVDAEVTLARDARKLTRLGCLAEQGSKVQHYVRSVSDYNQRLERARATGNLDEQRHLYFMIGLARDEARRTRDAIELCLDTPEGATPEIRVLSEPPPGSGPSNPTAGSGSSAFKAGPTGPLSLFGTTPTPWPSPVASNQPRTAPTLPLKYGLDLAAGLDTNDARQSSPDLQLVSSPAYGLELTPWLHLPGRQGSFQARYPFRYTSSGYFARDFALSGAALLEPEGGTHPTLDLALEARHDTFSPPELGAAGRDSARAGVDAAVRLVSPPRQETLRSTVGLDLEGARYTWQAQPEGALRLSAALGTELQLYTFPRQALVIEAQAQAISSTAALSEAQVAMAGTHSALAFLARAGVRGALSPTAQVDARVGVSSVAPRVEGALSPSLELASLPSFRLAFSRAAEFTTLEATLERRQDAPFYADQRLSTRAVLSLQAHTSGNLAGSLSVGGAHATYVLLYSPHPETQTLVEPEQQTQWGADGHAVIAYRFSGMAGEPVVSLDCLSAFRWGFPGEAEATQTLSVQRVLLTVGLEW